MKKQFFPGFLPLSAPIVAAEPTVEEQQEKEIFELQKQNAKLLLFKAAATALLDMLLTEGEVDEALVLAVREL
jgi:hypothetical protein